MARTVLTPTVVGRTGSRAIAFADGDAVNGHEFENTSGKNMVIVRNASENPVTATFLTTSSVDGLALADLAIVVAAGMDAVVGPFPAATYNQANDLVFMDLSSPTDVKVSLLNIG